MVEEQKITLETESPGPATVPAEVAKDVNEEKIQYPHVQQDSDDSEALAIVEKTVEPAPKKSSSGSQDRDVKLADLSKEKKLSFAKAWEDREKSKAENKAEKNISDVLAWENNKKAVVESQQKKFEEQLLNKKAEHAEKMNNKVAAIHKEAEERRAMVEAKFGEDILNAEETAAKYRATGIVPKTTWGCF
ncbi:unnamed protein product [Eruca vesicaria subsp. sativa]|uniref:Remorin n=1 Tax=Eruca vesicaria subsp. sativa TaxID=29727 RepID=A0ABC8M0D1_ERUVS|nr:unnamed protein product [Eruca vesicaria subsp. sativa]